MTIAAFPLAAAICVAVGPAAPSAGPSSASLQLALDKPVELKVEDAPIGEVFERLTEATGVRFRVGPDVYACLPYGEQTRLTVRIKNITLRKALTPVVAPQGMKWIIEDDAVRIRPADALLRMGRRATYDELRMLGTIHSAAIQPRAKGGEPVAQLRKLTGNEDLRLVFRLEGADREAALARADRVLPGTPADWLDMLCHGQGWTWYLWGDDIIILGKKAQVGRQLQRQVTLRYENAPLVDVLLDLARQGRVQLNMAPAVMEFVPAETRSSFNLIMSDATIAQVLEVISGATGLTFAPEDEGLRVEASDRLKKLGEGGADAGRRRTPFFLKKSVPLPDGSTVELLVRPDDLPEHVIEAIKGERARLFELLIRKYGPATTQPATTQPATTQPAG